MGLLDQALGRVHHDFGIVACINTDSIAPICVSKGTASEKDLVFPQSDILVIVHPHLAAELVDEFILFFTLDDMPIEVSEYFLIVHG